MPGIRKVSAPTYDDYDIEDDDPELIALKQKKALAKKKLKQKEQLKAQQQKKNINKYLADDTQMDVLLDEDEDLYRGSSKLPNWKPPKFISYEAMGLTSTKLNPSVRPCGFRTNGTNRMIKSTCLLARMKKLCMLKNTTPKLAVCITMYNENEAELKMTISGVL